MADKETKSTMREFATNDQANYYSDEKFPNLEEEYWSDEDETAEIFKIEMDIFDYESPLCMSFNEFNYLVKVDLELVTYDIERTGNYDDYMNEFNDEFEEP
ncbi:hypothetical protein Tco_0236259 [Tanacetum coccineum]